MSSTQVFANESQELDQAIRQLNAVKTALIRASQEAKIENQNIHRRAYFDYRTALKDVDTIKRGIQHYLNPKRQSPRNPRELRTLTDDYSKLR